MDIDAIKDPSHPFTRALNGVMAAAAETSMNPVAGVSSNSPELNVSSFMCVFFIAQSGAVCFWCHLSFYLCISVSRIHSLTNQVSINLLE